ncbi:hypothetical protein G9A89_020337 [Geosiphon pyriformis]|nr:hypothetical protein G9A89_020337 [Geosiphon pyriformis]
MNSWFKKLNTAPGSLSLEGDKLILPSFVLAELENLSRTRDTSFKTNQGDTLNTLSLAAPLPPLPYPLTFQILNPKTRLITYGGVLEFNSPDSKAYLPQWMYDSLSLEENQEVIIRLKELPKGTWVRFRPLSMEYREIVDYRAAFEAYLRSHYTTLTCGEILKVKQGDSVYQFLVDSLKPENAVQIIDTDLEVEIVPFSEEESSKTEEKGIANNFSKGPKERQTLIDEINQDVVSKDDYNYWIVKPVDRSQGINISLKIKGGGDADLIVSTQRKPKIDQHMWSDFSSSLEKAIFIAPTNSEYATCEDLSIGVHGYGDADTQYQLQITHINHALKSTEILYKTTDENPNTPGYAQCLNCGSWIPERTLLLHFNFCTRNNVKCTSCEKIMKLSEKANHWHCQHCDQSGDNPEAETKHIEIFHTNRQCSCGYVTDSLPEIANHKQTECPNKLITCRFCRNLVKQGEPSNDPRDLLEGLTTHESYCGNRTIDCVKCGRSVRLRDVPTHGKMHEIEKQNRTLPSICRNVNCIRPVAQNVLKLCQVCFGPFWSPADDPMNKKLMTRLARKYHQQLTVGCGQIWCKNKHCATSTNNFLDPTSAASMLIPLLQESRSTDSPGLYLCVDESVSRKRFLVDILYKGLDGQGQEGQYAIEFCVEAIEVSGEDPAKARNHLQANAPNRLH